MRSTRFLAGAATGVALVVLVTALTLAGLGRWTTRAAPSPASTATKSSGATPSATQSNISALVQQMLYPVSDAEWRAAANQLGMTVDDFRAALNSGKTVAKLGASHNVTEQQVKDAIVAAGQARVATAVQAGTISQSDADTLNNGLVVAIADKVTHANTTPDGTPTAADQAAAIRKQQAMPDAGVRETVSNAELNAAVQTLGITSEQFKQGAFPDGTLSRYAADAHVTAQQVKDAMLAAGQAALNQVVQNGTISQADAGQVNHDVVQPLAEKVFQMLLNSGQGTPTS